MSLILLVTAPAFGIFTDNFETNPFGAGGDWSRSGDVIWTGIGPGNDYVVLGLLGNEDNWLCRSFIAPTTDEYSIAFDYRFVGIDWVGKDDTVTVQVGISKDPLYTLFDASSDVDLTGGLFCVGTWQNVTTPPPILNLTGGQEYWLCFWLKEATGWWTPITSLHVDNVSLNISDVVSIVPAPSAVLIAGIGVSIVGWIKRRRML